MSPDLELARRLADAADAISLPHFRSGLAVETKPDLTPVTEADRAVEAELRRILAQERPDDAILGEEQGAAGSGIAPLDPRPDRRDAELRARNPGLGDADRARGGRRRAARHRVRAGARATLVGRARSRRLRKRRADPRLRDLEDRGLGALVRDRGSRARRSRGARGTRAVSATSGRTCSSPKGASTAPWTRLGVGEWDLAATQVIVEEAGGRFSDLAGEPRIDSGSAVASNGLLHDELLAALGTA